MIRCGWCGQATNPGRCGACGRDPEVPWFQRGMGAPAVSVEAPGRPALDVADVRHRLAEAKAEIAAAGRRVTVEALADVLDVSPRTVRRWREAVDGR